VETPTVPHAFDARPVSSRLNGPSPAYSSVRGLASLDEEAGDGAVEREAVIITIGHEGGDPSIPQ